ncbi:MAG: ribosomal protein S18-alanine N-acetyltransferase [Gammaproteobacteria bacterium]
MSAVVKSTAPLLRPMRTGDLAEVAVIERQAYEFPWSEGIFGDCLRVGYCCWVAELGKRVSGYGIMSVAVGEAHVLNLCVRPSAQGCGLGRALLAHMMQVARDHHATVVFLEVRPSNRVAINLYESTGFSRVGTRRGYYPAREGREDAFILSRDLAGG